MESERLVLAAFQNLSSEYIVLHSLSPWLRPERDLESEPLREGEADFVVLHPERGMLIMEVKGGFPELRDRRWYRSGREMKDPFRQAQRNRYALLKAVEERTGRRINRDMFTYGDVVVFPHCQYQGELPLNADARTFIDASGLDSFPLTLRKRLPGVVSTFYEAFDDSIRRTATRPDAGTPTL